MANRIQFRRDTSTRWASVNPILMSGEIGLETDTRRAKIGDGVKRWTQLEYAWTIVEDSQMVVSMTATTAQLKAIYDKCVAHPELAKNIVFLNSNDNLHYKVNAYKIESGVLHLNTLMVNEGVISVVDVKIASNGTIFV